MGLGNVLATVIYNGAKQCTDHGNTCTMGLGSVLAMVILIQWD